MESFGLRGSSIRRACPCGALIASDNSDRLCNRCRRNARPQVFGPPEVPESFWSHSVLAGAFADRDMGALLAAYRHHPHHVNRITQDRLATWLGISQAQLSRYETGENPIDRMDKLKHFAEVLRVPADRLWFDRTGATGRADADRDPAPDVFSAAWDAPSIARSVEETTRSDLAISRRAALTGAAAVTVGSALVEPLQRWLNPVPSMSRWSSGAAVSEDELAALQRVSEGLRGWGGRGGAGLARKAVLGQLDELAERLQRAPAGPTTERAFFIGAELAKVAASMSWDAGLHDAAQRYYVLAVRMAKAGRNDPFAAMCLAAMARQMFDLGRPEDGLDLVQLGQYGTRRTATPTLRAVLLTREAWAYAQMGQVREFHRAIGMAQECFTNRNASAEPHWLHNFDEAELEGVIGARLRDLAAHDPRQAPLAEQHIRRALALRDPSRLRNRAFDVIGLARTRVVAGDPEEACALIKSVLPTAVKLRSGRVLRKLQDFARESARHRQLPAVRETRDAIRTVRTA
ncbi:helix-turn-helix domain-containing protein [Goodfellowiella coeruleoviolacea]|uniref:Helix-turn-helix domain-containing protein n=1 Tax=Goodfellowiella coeruleoviolacea TaxID=334858 RepID=A0AAE3KK20_9PSEU|nr:helix-turn-helix transcriptional regulator [Goodfellowiella coeruleoviolacea]MCP2170225.1 Helix-turn-helix domain-containing protein [Goodfellowiella coeruleoviolacea]